MEKTAEISAEERIKKAAKIVFTQKGFLGATIRDIAAEADLNVASVNYYFRSKDNLFQIVMAETIERLFAQTEPVVYDTALSLNEKIELLADHFINSVYHEPDLPFFIVSEIMAGSNNMPMIRNLPSLLESDFARQIRLLKANGAISYNPFHLILNLGSMLLFPFLGMHQATRFGGLSKEEFYELMKERKKLIPFWIGGMTGV